MKLETALKKFLNLIETDAQRSYKTAVNGQWVWNEEIWQKNDPEYYKHWKRLTTLIEDEAPK